MIEFAPLEFRIQMNWHDAVIYCQFFEYGGHRDWRLPTVHELREFDFKLNAPGWVWSSVVADPLERTNKVFVCKKPFINGCYDSHNQGVAFMSNKKGIVVPVRVVA